MNKADSDRIRELCAVIAVEKDRHKFLALVEELNKSLAAKDDRRQRLGGALEGNRNGAAITQALRELPAVTRSRA